MTRQLKKIKSITFKLKSAKEVGNHISVNVSKKQKVVTLTYDVKNGSKVNYTAGQDAIIYLKGEKADDYALGTDKTATIKPGQSAEVSQSFVIPNNTRSLEIELGQALKENGKRALYKVNLK